MAYNYALRRNGTCLADSETECYLTRAPFYSCCPSDFKCSGRTVNTVCCPSGVECSDKSTAESVPMCANATWDLYNNGGYFCCEQGKPGFNLNNTNVCASPGAQLNNVDNLEILRPGQDPSATSSVSPSASSPTSSAATTTAAASTSSTPVGAIAGGVVGGVAVIALLTFLAWYLLRRKRKQKHTGETDSSLQHLQHPGYELDMGQNVYEADGSHKPNGAAKELPAQQRPMELPAS